MSGSGPGAIITGAGIAPAKVNLSLHVTGRRMDGYHLLDSLVAFADIGDHLTVTPGDGLTVTGPFAAGVPTDDTNLIRRALALAGVRRAVTLDKRLPHPAGLGGGSSDAAAVLRLVGANLTLEEVLSLGADVPVCLLGRAARMEGIGEIVVPVDLPRLSAVLVNPGVPAPTAEVFARLETRDNPAMSAVPRFLKRLDLIRWIGQQRNDLEVAARNVQPIISEVLQALRASGAGLARMSGSGATCFGLYADDRAALSATSRLRRSGWWVAACTLT
ncbi:MAG: 4-(cytidine 5'-diphospho)-2-C-methyl-D-erythritol kinase [Jannaschia sp.]